MTSSSPRVTFRFGEFELDTVAYELRRKGWRVRLARQPMDLLVLLLERPRELVSRDDIAKRLFGDEPNFAARRQSVDIRRCGVKA